MILREETKNNLINKSKKADNYKDTSKGKNRYERRTKSRVGSSVKQFNAINMNKLFKDDILEVDVQVHGETDDYLVKVSFSGFLDNLYQELTKFNETKVDLRMISRALIKCFNTEDIYSHCTCLHADTLIKLLDGTTSTVSDLLNRFKNGEKLYVYSVDENGDFKPGEVEKVWITKTETNFIKVTLDNNREIITTTDHRYMLRDGSYCEAQNLKIGQSLMPLYFQNKGGYETIKYNSDPKLGYNSTYKMVADYFLSNEIAAAKSRVNPEDNMPYDVAIHHKNFNKSNNNPDNLQPMTAREHWDYHSNTINRLWEDPEFRERNSQRSREHMIRLNANPTEAMKLARHESGIKNSKILNSDENIAKFHNIRSKNMKQIRASLTTEQISKNSRQAWENGAFDTQKFKEAAIKRGEFLSSPEIQALAKAGVQKYWDNLSDIDRINRAEICAENGRIGSIKIIGTKRSEETKLKQRLARLTEDPQKAELRNLKIRDSKIIKIFNKILSDAKPLTLDTYNEYKKSYCCSPDILKYFSSFDEALNYFKLDDRYNHKVLKIDYLTLDSQPVYDIKVKNFSNFLVEAGVILHNCSDFKFRHSYWFTVNNLNSIPGEQPSNGKEIANPHDTKGAGCKHIQLILNNLVWLNKVASVINNYINYMELHKPRLYADIIYPAIYKKKYEEPVQLEIGDDSNDLETDKDTIDKSNQDAIDRTRFKKGNQSGIQFASDKDDNELEGQLKIDNI